MMIRTTCKAVNCSSNVARVKYLIGTSNLHLHLLLFTLVNSVEISHSRLVRKVRRLYEGLKLYYDRFSSRNLQTQKFFVKSESNTTWSIYISVFRSSKDGCD